MQIWLRLEPDTSYIAVRWITACTVTVTLCRNDRNHRVPQLDDILIIGTCTVWIKQKLSTAPYLRDNPIPFIGPAVTLMSTRIASITSVLQSIFIWQLCQITVIPTEHFTAVSWDSTARVERLLTKDNIVITTILKWIFKTYGSGKSGFIWLRTRTSNSLL